MKNKQKLMVVVIMLFAFLLCGCGEALVKKPSDAYVTKSLRNVKSVTGVERVTEGHDPNDLLNRTGGYVGCVYFSVDDIDLTEYGIYDNVSIVDVGTIAGGCIEIFETSKEAKKRDEYLSNFDNTLIKSGSHQVVGSVIIRTSSALSGERQKSLTNEIKNELVKGKAIPVVIVIGVLAVATVVVAIIVISKKKHGRTKGEQRITDSTEKNDNKIATTSKAKKVITTVVVLLVLGSVATVGISVFLKKTAASKAKNVVTVYLNGMMNGDSNAVNSVCSANLSDNGEYTAILNRDPLLYNAFAQGMGSVIDMELLSDEVKTSYDQLCLVVAQNSVRRYSNPMMIDSLSSISKIVSFILPFPLFFNILLIIIKETKGKVQPSIRLPAGGIFVFPQPSSRPQPFHCRITRQIHFLQTTGTDHFP